MGDNMKLCFFLSLFSLFTVSDAIAVRLEIGGDLKTTEVSYKGSYNTYLPKGQGNLTPSLEVRSPIGCHIIIREVHWNYFNGLQNTWTNGFYTKSQWDAERAALFWEPQNDWGGWYINHVLFTAQIICDHQSEPSVKVSFKYGWAFFSDIYNTGKMTRQVGESEQTFNITTPKRWAEVASTIDYGNKMLAGSGSDYDYFQQLIGSHSGDVKIKVGTSYLPASNAVQVYPVGKNCSETGTFWLHPNGRLGFHAVKSGKFNCSLNVSIEAP
jgi:hypothetical protein